MEGDVSYEQSLRARMDLLHPSKFALERCARLHPGELSPLVAEFVARLQARGQRVFLVSGGLRTLVVPIARRIGVPEEQVYANQLLFHWHNGYRGVDFRQPTSRSGGNKERSE